MSFCFASSMIGLHRSILSAILQFVFLWLKVSVAAAKRLISLALPAVATGGCELISFGSPVLVIGPWL